MTENITVAVISGIGTLVGVVVGGLITWLSSSHLSNQQYEHQLKMENKKKVLNLYKNVLLPIIKEYEDADSELDKLEESGHDFQANISPILTINKEMYNSIKSIVEENYIITSTDFIKKYKKTELDYHGKSIRCLREKNYLDGEEKILFDAEKEFKNYIYDEANKIEEDENNISNL